MEVGGEVEVVGEVVGRDGGVAVDLDDLRRRMGASDTSSTQVSTLLYYPTKDALLINCRLSSDAEILLLSIYKSATNVQKTCNVLCIFHLSFHFWMPLLVVG